MSGKADLYSRSLTGFVYKKAKQLGKLDELREIFERGVKNTQEKRTDDLLAGGFLSFSVTPKTSFETFVEEEGEFYAFSFDMMTEIAGMLGYKTEPIHHEATWVSKMMDDYKNYEID